MAAGSRLPARELSCERTVAETYSTQVDLPVVHCYDGLNGRQLCIRAKRRSSAYRSRRQEMRLFVYVRRRGQIVLRAIHKHKRGSASALLKTEIDAVPDRKTLLVRLTFTKLQWHKT